MRAPGCRCGRTRSSERPCSESSAVCGSDQPSRAAARLKADGAGTTVISRGVDAAREHRADAVMERIARGEHADLAAAMMQHFVGGAVERARPRPRRAANERRREAEMAPAAEHDFGGADQPARHRAQALDAVLADADDGQPARRCGSVAARSHQDETAWHASSFSAAPRKRGNWPGASPAAPASTITLSLAGRTASPAAQPVPVRVGGFGGADGLADYLVSERIDALIDATHPYANVISANAVAAARRSGVPLVALRRPPWIAVAGDRWIEVERCRAKRCGRSGKRRAASLSRSAATSWRRSRRAAALLSDPQRRSGRSAAAAAACRLRHRPRPVRRSRRPRAADRASHRRGGRQEQRRRPRPTARSPRRARSASRSSCCAGQPLPDGAAVETVEDAIAWLDHALTSAAARGV